MSCRYTKSLLLTQEDNASNADRNRKRILDIIGKEYAVIVDSRGDCKTPTAKKGLVVQEADAASMARKRHLAATARGFLLFLSFQQTQDFW